MSWNQQEDCPPELASLDQGAGPIKGFRRFCSKIFCGLSLTRSCNFCVFCCVCIGSLLGQVAPVIVGVSDTACLVILYFVCPNTRHESYSFSTNLLDLVLLSAFRSLCCLTSYLACGSSSNCQKPYLYTAYGVGVLSLVFIFFKAIKFDYDDDDETWVAVLMFLTTAIGSIAHVLVAQPMYAAAKKRRKAQISPRYRYSGSEKDWLVEQNQVGYSTISGGPRNSSTNWSDTDSDDESPDMPGKVFTDVESKFMVCEGVEIHYKMLEPPTEEQASDTSRVSPPAVILVHGFGGGVFSWRHLMLQLVRRCNCIVVAFDRPGFGLTERPYRHSFPDANNPYALHSQVKMIFSLCKQLSLERIVLIGHADGALLSMLTAVAAIEGEVTGVKVAGLAMIAPNMSSEMVPTSTRLLLQTKLGRQMLRPLLRSEIGEVALRRAWHDSAKLSRDVLELYKTPLRVEGWDRALYEVARLKGEVEAAKLPQMFALIAGLPTVFLAGEFDRVVSPRKCAAVAAEFPGSQYRVVPTSGHLPHEESPLAVVGLLANFVSNALVTGGSHAGPS